MKEAVVFPEPTKVAAHGTVSDLGPLAVWRRTVTESAPG
jgi:hypothetical protein